MPSSTGMLRISGLHDHFQLGNLFFNIVTNATVENPLKSKMPGSESSKKDELNLLNRHERLYMALKISMELKKIDHDLVMICYYCKYTV